MVMTIARLFNIRLFSYKLKIIVAFVSVQSVNHLQFAHSPSITSRILNPRNTYIQISLPNYEPATSKDLTN